MPKYISGQDSDGIMPEDDYDFVISSARLKTSKAGSEMIEIDLSIEYAGNKILVRDFLVFNGSPFNCGRIDQLRVAIGETILPGEEIEVLPGDLMNKKGRVHIIQEEWNNKKVNRVGSYLEPEDELPGLPKTKSMGKAVTQPY